MSDHKCLNDEMLAAYFDGQLSESQEAEIHRAVSDCSGCSELLASLGVVIHESAMAHQMDEVPASVTQRVRFGRCTTEGTAEFLTLAVRWLEDTIAPLAQSLQPLDLATGTYEVQLQSNTTVTKSLVSITSITLP